MSREIFCDGKELCRDGWHELNGCLSVGGRHLGSWVRVGGLRDDLGLAGFDEDECCDQDNQYGYQEGDHDWLDGRVSYALFGSRIARCWLLLTHGYLDAEAVVRG